MTDLLSLYRYAEQLNIEVDWFSMGVAHSLSVPLEDGYCIAVDPYKLAGIADEKVKLGHELGHCATHSFYNRYAPLDLRRRHELHADRWAILRLVPQQELECAIAGGYLEVWELADYFDVTESFMRKVVAYYRQRDTQ